MGQQDYRKGVYSTKSYEGFHVLDSDEHTGGLR